jgi:3-hydroxyisobutyrate dehydrogenase
MLARRERLVTADPRIGFLGLGTMGEPMATRLLAASRDLTVWNRSAPARDRLVALGARAVASPVDVFAGTDVVILMLANGDVIDGTLGRRGARIDVEVAGRVVVNMGTVAPSYSLALGEQLEAAGATFVEAPVSGSKVPALAGELVGMMAGEPSALDLVGGLLAPLTSAVFRCGPVPQALETKLAVNTYLITMVVGLAEAFAYAERRDVDPVVLRRVLDAGPMASTVSRGKLAKLVDGDLSAQASVSDVLYNSRLILDAADRASAAVPLMTACAALLAEAESRGQGTSDMVAVVDALRATAR